MPNTVGDGTCFTLQARCVQLSSSRGSRYSRSPWRAREAQALAGAQRQEEILAWKSAPRGESTKASAIPLDQQMSIRIRSLVGIDDGPPSET